MQRSAFIISALTAVSECQTANQKLAYPRFAEAMAEYEEEYEWEPIEFTTEDSYVLTSFIIKRRGIEMGNPPVLVHHGNGQDAASWITSLTPDEPRFDEIIPEPEPVVEEETVEEEPVVEEEEQVDEEATTEDADAADYPEATDEA